MFSKHKSNDSGKLDILSLCLIYKLSFFIDTYAWDGGKHSIYRVSYFLWFQSSTRGLGMYHIQIRKATVYKESVYQYKNLLLEPEIDRHT